MSAVAFLTYGSTRRVGGGNGYCTVAMLLPKENAGGAYADEFCKRRFASERDAI